MTLDQNAARTRFFLRQALLLVLTIVLFVYCAVPLFHVVKLVINPSGFKVRLEVANREAQAIQNDMDVASSRILMGGGDEQVQEELKLKVAQLERKLELKELENKGFKDQQETLNRMLQIMEGKSLAVGSASVTFWHALADLLVKLIGAIGSFFSGGMFLMSWWRTRRRSRGTVEAA